MSDFDLPYWFNFASEEGGEISAEFNADEAIVITIRDDVSREEAYVELAGAKIREFFEGFTALLLGHVDQVSLDVTERDREDDAERLILMVAGGGVCFDIHVRPESNQSDGGPSVYSVRLEELAAHTVYAFFNSMVLRKRISFP